MAILNRDLDQSQQKERIAFTFTPVVLGQTAFISGQSLIVGPPMSFPYIIESIKVACLGVSGTPTLRPLIYRSLVSGSSSVSSGVTVISCGLTTINVGTYATVGPVGFSVFGGVNGITYVPTLQIGAVGDILCIDQSSANSAIQAITVEYVVRKSQDIVQYNGV